MICRNHFLLLFLFTFLDCGCVSPLFWFRISFARDESRLAAACCRHAAPVRAPSLPDQANNLQHGGNPLIPTRFLWNFMTRATDEPRIFLLISLLWIAYLGQIT